jgi:uncharacterized protein
MRYLVRLANIKAYTPQDVKVIQAKIRELLGSADKIGNLRVSTTAIELDLFAEPTDLRETKNLLEDKISKIITLRSIETRVSTKGETESLREGIELFNQERYWESHEVLEDIWHPARGVERDIIQGLILTAAALVHYQKNENDVCLSILRRAMQKLNASNHFKDLDIKRLKGGIDRILKDNTAELLRIEWLNEKTTTTHL